jgi:Phage terminase, small subunit
MSHSRPIPQHVPSRPPWLWLAPRAHALGLLSEVDIPAFEIAVTTVGYWHEAKARAEAALRDYPMGGHILAGPLFKATLQFAMSASKLLADFGLTPSGRTRVAVEKPFDEGKFKGLLAG